MSIKVVPKAAPKVVPKLSSQRGLTLIELAVVILLLGILSATAIPRLLDTTREAKIAALQAMGGAISTATQAVYSRSVLAGVHTASDTFIDFNGDGTKEVRVNFGYISGRRTTGISKVMGNNFATEWTWSSNNGRSVFFLTTAAIGGRSGNYINNTAVTREDCYLTYRVANSASSAPTIAYVTTGC